MNGRHLRVRAKFSPQNEEKPPKNWRLFFGHAPGLGACLWVKVPPRAVIASEVKRNCTRATKRGKETWSVNHESMDKTHVEGAVKQGEQAPICKALITKARWPRCGDCGEGMRSYPVRIRLMAERSTE